MASLKIAGLVSGMKTIERQAAEIERLRNLLRECYDYREIGNWPQERRDAFRERLRKEFDDKKEIT
jgi:hypothetical protein